MIEMYLVNIFDLIKCSKKISCISKEKIMKKKSQRKRIKRLK